MKLNLKIMFFNDSHIEDFNMMKLTCLINHSNNSYLVKFILTKFIGHKKLAYY